MEFGKVNPAQLSGIDFRLPDDPPSNEIILKQSSGNTQFYIGCARWGNKDWVGKYYPVGTKDKDFLTEYARIFNCIELNATYYGSPSLAQINSWKEKAGDADFLFCPKLPQVITHQNRLLDSEELVNEFVYSMAGLGSHAGPFFLMPDPQTSTLERGVIERFITNFPEGAPLFLELRHPSFYTNGYDAAMFSFLTASKRGTVITDTSGRRDCVHMQLTIPEVFIRFVGNGLDPTDYTRINDWVGRLKTWMELGLERVYFIVHQPDEMQAASLIAYLIGLLNEQCGTDLKAPKLLTPPTLF